MQNGLIQLLEAGAQPYRREVALTRTQAAGGALRPADILLVGWDASTDMALDVTVIHPIRAGVAHLGEDTVRTALARAEEAKVALYDRPCRREG